MAAVARRSPRGAVALRANLARNAANEPDCQPFVVPPSGGDRPPRSSQARGAVREPAAPAKGERRLALGWRRGLAAINPETPTPIRNRTKAHRRLRAGDLVPHELTTTGRHFKKHRLTDSYYLRYVPFPPFR